MFFRILRCICVGLLIGKLLISIFSLRKVIGGLWRLCRRCSGTGGGMWAVFWGISMWRCRCPGGFFSRIRLGVILPLLGLSKSTSMMFFGSKASLPVSFCRNPKSFDCKIETHSYIYAWKYRKILAFHLL